jgi:hypothetical protein
MTQIRKTGGTLSGATGVSQTSNSAPSKTKETPAPSASDQAVLSGKNTQDNLKAAARTGALQGSGATQTPKRKSRVLASDSNEDVQDFENIAKAAGIGETEAQNSGSQGISQSSEATAASANTPAQQTFSHAMANACVLLAGALSQSGKNITPEQIYSAVQQAQKEQTPDPLGRAADILNQNHGLGLKRAAFKALFQAAQAQAFAAENPQVKQLAGRLGIDPLMFASAWVGAREQARQMNPNQYQQLFPQLLAHNLQKDYGVEPSLIQNHLNAPLISQIESQISPQEGASSQDAMNSQLAAILSQKTGKNFTSEQIKQAYAEASQGALNGENLHQLAAQKLGISQSDLEDAINQIARSHEEANTLGGGGAQPPGGGNTPPPTGTPPQSGGPNQPQMGGPGSIINSDYLQNLQNIMQGLGINIPPQVLQAQQQMMNQLYGYGLLQQAVQTQRAGLEQYMQILNTILQMNISVMQNQTAMLQEIIAARQKVYQMQQQMCQNMFTTTMEVAQGWTKAYQQAGG